MFDKADFKKIGFFLTRFCVLCSGQIDVEQLVSGVMGNG
jgi:hypothetical protein